MNVTPRYLGRGSWLSRRDPRVLVLVIVFFIFTVVQVWDGRVVLGLLVLALAYYRSAGIPFAAVRRNWVFAISFVTLLTLVNSVLTGQRVSGADLHVYFQVPILGTPVSAESLAYAASQWMRFIAMVAIGFPLAFCMAPADFGATFARLGIPEKFAVGLDLTFRFIPSLAVDYQETIDAQRVRGYEPTAGNGSVVARLRQMIPILAPLTISAIAGAEDTIDAMDLRGFGTGRRTWLRELDFDRTDRLLVGFFAALLIVMTIAGYTLGTSSIWVPGFLIPG
ncbi:MAG: energy-coupling factor transporter transmembrane protein EcfT [Chloroflexi bacterium]|nr:energy-coupling factor transporter transmembrane protein EcfT [Chloroflexota bacterium]